MAVSGLNFSAQVDDWVRATDQRMTAVFKESTQRVASIASNGVPVDTGFARASVRASLEQMPSIDPNARGAEGASYDASGALGEITAVITNAQLGQTIYVGWTASYVIYLEYGHSKQAPAGFVRIAAEQWGQIVNEVTAEAKTRASGSTGR